MKRRCINHLRCNEEFEVHLDTIKDAADIFDSWHCPKCLAKINHDLVENFRNNDCHFSQNERSRKRAREYYQENKPKILHRTKQYRLNQSEAYA